MAKSDPRKGKTAPEKPRGRDSYSLKNIPKTPSGKYPSPKKGKK